MKKQLVMMLVFFLLALFSYAQVPQGFNYQAVVRNTEGEPIAEQAINVRLTIQNEDGTTEYYKETHSSITSPQGVISLAVGSGTVVSGNMNDTPWESGGVFLKVEVDPSGGSNYSLLGTSSLLAVPYALHALSAKEVSVPQDAGVDDPLFVVRNSAGQIVFAVYQTGVRIYVEDGLVKSTKGGFAVGGLSDQTKQGAEYLRVTPDSIRINFRNPTNPTKSTRGGFAVGGLSDQTKALEYDLLVVTPDSTTIATTDQSRRVSVKTPSLTQPLLSVDGSFRMGADESLASGSMSYDGQKFLTYEELIGKGEVISKQFVVTGTPEVSTGLVSNITRNSATIDGTVIADGGSEVVACGVCWSTSPAPTLSNSSLNSGSGVGAFTSDITGLNGSTTYYARAYATNSQFTNYGDEVTFTTLPAQTPTITTTSISSISSSSAVSGGNITDDGSATITARGVCWNDTGNPSLVDDFTTDGIGSGTFTSNISSLEANKTYFVRAYATNSVGTSFGEELTFATTDLPVLSTNPITAVTGTTATSGGNIFAGGELSITQRGVCWNTTGNPTLENSFTENGSGSGSFVSNIAGLTLGTTYFVRAYATNATGTAYGNEYYFTTLNVPAITTNEVTMVTGNSADCGGNISNNGGAVVTERGLCWSLTPNPTIDNDYIVLGDGSGSFSSTITDLTIGTNYYVRAYAINNIGIAYGNERLFTTQNFATVITSDVYDITYTSAKGGGNVTSDGGAAITQRGVCWNTEGSPTLENSFTNDGEGTGEFLSNINSLAANNTYYVRAYTINSIGTTYGNEVSFSTPTIVPPPPGIPTVGTVKVTTESDGIHTGGYVLSDGGSAVNQRGVCWSTSENPTIADDFTIDGSGTGQYSSIISTIVGCGVPYYIRAYATNTTGTGYGNQIAVSSGLLPTVSETAAITSITKSTAVSGVTVTNDGGCEITEIGVCWNRYPNPTISNSKVVVGVVAGTYSANLTGLFPNDTYYVRAYATNSRGTAYGPELVFTTEAGTLGLSIGDFHAGGYIFYLDETGDHGLVCAPEDNGSAPWGCQGTSIPTEAGVGTGGTNTATILANCPEEGTAAWLCHNLELNGYTDWFLPSKDELNLMYQNLAFVGIGNFLRTEAEQGIYQTSTEQSEFGNYEQYFWDGTSSVGMKSGAFVVRAVRSF